MPLNHDAVWLKHLHDTFVEALRSNDFNALGACYTQAAILLVPARQIIAGSEAIVEYWRKAERVQDVAFHATDTKALGNDALREAGSLIVTKRGKGRETFNTAGKYVTTWLRSADSWQIDSMTWNGAGRAGGGRRKGGRGRPGGRTGAGGGQRRAGGGGRGQRDGRGRKDD